MATYLVTREGAPEGEKPRLVDARTKTAAIAHVARTSYNAEPVGLKTALAWSKQGVELEEAKADAE